MHTIDPESPYEWDEEKARSNLRKHGIEFADAVAVFEDEHAVTREDLLSAVDEQRYVTIGRDHMDRVIVVAYTLRRDRVRLFSARRADPRERRLYLAEES